MHWMVCKVRFSADLEKIATVHGHSLNILVGKGNCWAILKKVGRYLKKDVEPYPLVICKCQGDENQNFAMPRHG